jgi:hypothetical protein
MNAAYELLANDPSLNEVMVYDAHDRIKLTETYNIGPDSLVLYLFCEGHLAKLIKSLQSPHCGINTLNLNTSAPSLMSALELNQLPRITTLCIALDRVTYRAIIDLMCSPHSSITTLVFSMHYEIFHFADSIQNLNCKVTTIFWVGVPGENYVEDYRLMDILIRQRQFKVMMFTLASASERVGRKSALRRLDFYMRRHLGTFLG